MSSLGTQEYEWGEAQLQTFAYFYCMAMYVVNQALSVHFDYMLPEVCNRIIDCNFQPKIIG